MAQPDTVDLRPLKNLVRKDCEAGHPFRVAVAALPDLEPWDDLIAQLRVLLPLTRMK